ncbi:MAG: HlyC/CorC family transporter [Sedimentisphaerales bacterium]|nr:HlyC/CorC family transporter [Sedimentisphaerales bacterium]
MDDPGSWALIISVLCIVLTTFFSVTNLALRHPLWTKLEEAFAVKKKPHSAQFIRQHLARLIYTTAVFRLLANLGLLLSLIYQFSANFTDQNGHRLVTLLGVFLFSGIILMVFSITIPHTWAKHMGTLILANCFGVLRVMMFLAWPIISVMLLLDPLVRRLSGVTAEDAAGSLEERQEELLNVVEEQEKEGVVDEQEREMIESVLEFGDTTAGEIMTPRTELSAIDVKSGFSEAVEILVREGHSRYPVYEENIDNIIGMLYAKDLLVDLNNPDQSSGIQHRLRKPYFVPQVKKLPDLLHDFQTQKVHLAVVLDEYGGTAGVVTIEDILEEIVGEITDEYEPLQPEPLKKLDDNTFEVDARYEVDQLNCELDINIPEDESYETIGGFAFAKLGSIPKIGRTFEHDNLTFTVLDAGQRKINRLKIVKLPPPDQQQE